MLPDSIRTGEISVSATGFWTGFRIFGSYPATLCFPAEGLQLANVSHTLVSKVETIAVCERERVARVFCAALVQCMPMHAHFGAHACSVPQEERKSQCTICQSCNLKLLRRCQSKNTQFCALCRFGRQTWTWEGACAYGLFTIAPASQQVTRLDLRLVFGSQSQMSSASCQFSWRNSRCRMPAKVSIHVGDTILSATFGSKRDANLGFTYSHENLHTWQRLHPCSRSRRQLQRGPKHGRRLCSGMSHNSSATKNTCNSN